MDEIDVESDATAQLDLIAGAIDRAAGGDGRGLKPDVRALLFDFLDSPSAPKWQQLRRMSLTTRHTFWVAVMRHCKLGMYQLPTPEQVIDAMRAAHAHTIRP